MAYLVDYHTHPAAHGEMGGKAYTEEYLLKFIHQAEKKGIKELGFTDHERYYREIDQELIHFLKKNSSLKILLGLEFNYRPGREDEIIDLQARLPLDYSIGSVHYIDEWEFDHPANIDQYQTRDINQVYLRYFQLVRKAAATGLFSVMGHLDLIKVFGFKPEGIEIKTLVQPVLEEIKKQGLVIELNTNGVNKPIGEYYPSREIIEQAYKLKIPITTGSDAHLPERTGEGIDEVVLLAKNCGYRKQATFQNKKMTAVSFT